MICPLWYFCKYANRDIQCTQDQRSCKYFKDVRNWITNLIDNAIENALEDLR